MLWSLGQPVSFAGFVLSFLVAVALRTVAIRITARAVGLEPRRAPIGFKPRHDFDVFGVVAALIGGMGWGKGVDVDDVPAYRGRGRRAMVFGAGPLSVFLLSQVVLLGFALGFGSDRLLLSGASPVNVLGGVPIYLVHSGGVTPVSLVGELVAAFGIGLFCFALFDLIPLPPLDGWGLLWSCLRQPGEAAQKAKMWLVGNNLGMAILFLLLIFPFGSSLVFVILDVIGAPLLGVWAW